MRKIKYLLPASFIFLNFHPGFTSHPAEEFPKMASFYPVLPSISEEDEETQHFIKFLDNNETFVEEMPALEPLTPKGENNVAKKILIHPTSPPAI
jgi:hypothetical protein